jgi:aminoglycoside phosphotransferase (APT) family kinase protein
MEGHASLLKGDQSWRLNVNHRISRCYENLSQYEKYFIQAKFEKNKLIDSIEIVKNLKWQDLKPSYLHGDLYHRHVIVDKNILPVGLIDWGDVHIGNPGIDLAIGMIFTKSMLDTFLKIYDDVNETLFHVMLFHSFCHSMSFLPYAFQQNKRTLKRWAIMVLQRAMDEIKDLNI